MNTFMEPLRNKPKCRVELHIHVFPGSPRHETLWEVMRQKKMKLPGNGSLEALKSALRITQPIDLCNYLKGFEVYIDCIIGDLELIERISYEFVEDRARQSVAYCEARFSPHFLLPKDSKHYIGHIDSLIEAGGNDMRADDVVDAVLRGFRRGDEEFGTKTTLILSLLRGYSQWDWDVLRLCEEYRDKGVVGIDRCGAVGDAGEDIALSDDVSIAVFKAAKERGIHRTVHAGEAGSPNSVKTAVETYGAERIGHGYKVIEDEAIYEMCLRENIHFEVCPFSSYLTGAMQSLRTSSKRHPVLRFEEDKASFSINTDDPTITCTTFSDEYRLLMQWGFTEAQITRSNFQAALHSFLNPEEKKKLIDQLKEAYGIIDYAIPESSTSSSTSHSSTPKPSVAFGTWAERS